MGPAAQRPPAPGGRTLRPGDEGESPEALLRAEGLRVQQRVQEQLDDGLARLRVENGLAHSYFGTMDHALEKGLTGAPLFDYQGVLKHFFKATPGRSQALREFFSGMHGYGASGSPYAAGEPSDVDRLEDVARSGRAGARARTQRSSVDILNEYSRSTGALHVKLELTQSPTGQVLDVKLLEGSGNVLFDKYVLERVPESLSALESAPELFSAHTRGPVRSVWAIDGYVSFARTLKLSKLDELDISDAAYFAAVLPLGISFEETRGEITIPDLRRPHFDVRTRLLRVY